MRWRRVAWSAVISCFAAFSVGTAAQASCISKKEVAAGAAANFVGHVIEIREGASAPVATVAVESAASGPVEIGQRVEVTGTKPAAPGFAGSLRLAGRYRFWPQDPKQPFEVNECLSQRLAGFVLPKGSAYRVVTERSPWWTWPAIAAALLAGSLLGYGLARRRAATLH